MNTVGKDFKITLFGASHGPCVGCVIEGFPAGMTIDQGFISERLDLRRPVGEVGTPRREKDEFEFLSGMKEGRSTSVPISVVIWNRDVDSSKYTTFRKVPRPGHADFTALTKYGEGHDIRGGGQFSGRMTAPLVVAGALAETLISNLGIEVTAYTESIGKIEDREEHSFEEIGDRRIRNAVRAASSEVAEKMEEEILLAKEDNDSVGGTIRCICRGLPTGVGEPFFDTLEGELAKMMFAIPGIKGIDFGAGFRAAGMRGSEHNDPFVISDGEVKTPSNNAGGILGGMSTGMPLDFRVAVKPTASISREQKSVDLEKMEETTLTIEGRHDPCIVPRAVVVVETLTAAVLADLCLRGDFIER